MSPYAAASDWVEHEISHWNGCKRTQRSLPVLTGGTHLACNYLVAAFGDGEINDTP